MNRLSKFTRSPAGVIANRLVASILLAAAGPQALAEEAPTPSPPGLPEALDWTFDFSAGLGTFGFNNSLYTNPRPDQPSGDLSDNWSEASLTAGITGVYTTSNSSQFYGRFSAVGERTYNAAPDLVGGDANSFKEEDLYIGWRSGNSFGNGENVLDFTLGRAQYKLGQGMLLWDGAAEGGSRGGYWTNARKAFEFAAIGRFKPGAHTVEAFFLEKDDLPEGGSDSEVWGLNYEYAFGEETTLGATYMSWNANPAEAPQRDGMDLYNARVVTAPFPGLRGLSFVGEYALQDNGVALDSTAWNALVGYQFESAWQPKLTYRYAIFEGDDVTTPENEDFDSLLTGFYDWGSWWQGEIAGGYFLSNSNLISHQLRVNVKPRESISTGLIFYDFRLDERASFDTDTLVTSDELAMELDWYMDWTINDHFVLSFVLAYAEPGDAVEQSLDRTNSFEYGMIFAAYSF